MPEKISTTQQIEELQQPIILGAAGDIGRTALQQSIDQGLVPAGVVLTPHRLEDAAARRETARQIASNFVPGGEERVLSRVELIVKPSPVLRVGDLEIPVFTPASQHEILQEGHPTIDATGQHKTREKLAPFIEAGSDFVVVTSPIHEDEGIQATVYGVNSGGDVFEKAYQDRLLSTSSCTTTAVSTFLAPILEAGITPACVTVDVSHARTKSNSKKDITDNIKLSSSGAIKEVPKVLGESADDLVFDLQCTRADANCGSVASVTMIFGTKNPKRNPHNLRREIKTALNASDSVFVLDGEIKDTKGVVGSKESAIINVEDLIIRESHESNVIMVTGLYVFYDNVSGYTRSVMDSYKGMSEASQGSASSQDSSELVRV